MSNGEPPTLGELSRGQNQIMAQIVSLHKELTEGHSRLRHDLANAQTIAAANQERIIAQGREIGDMKLALHNLEGEVKTDIREVRSDNKKLLWAIIGAYGALTLTAVSVFAGRV